MPIPYNFIRFIIVTKNYSSAITASRDLDQSQTPNLPASVTHGTLEMEQGKLFKTYCSQCAKASFTHKTRTGTHNIILVNRLELQTVMHSAIKLTD